MATVLKNNISRKKIKVELCTNQTRKYFALKKLGKKKILSLEDSQKMKYDISLMVREITITNLDNFSMFEVLQSLKREYKQLIGEL